MLALTNWYFILLAYLLFTYSTAYKNNYEIRSTVYKNECGHIVVYNIHITEH